MKTVIVAVAIVLATVSASAAQKGTAEPGYYPLGYAGDTWTGVFFKKDTS
jgi:hypothetical protein